MSKADIIDVTGLGFAKEQFGGVDDFDVEDSGLVARILEDVALEVRVEVGASTYDAADAAGADTEKLNFKRIKNAEMYLAGAELWRRIEAFERRDKIAGREGSGAETISSRALKNAKQFEAIAWAEIEKITGVLRAGGSSFGYVESGQYSEVGA